MIAYYDIEQGTYEWHEIKYGKIGGTLSSSILAKTDTLLNDLISSRLEPFEYHDDEYKSNSMERGSFMELEAIVKVSEKHKVLFKSCGWLNSSEFEHVGISPDGISACETIQVEVKCPQRKNHTKYIREGIVPLEYVDQVTHAFLVNEKLDKLIFASYRPESLIPLFSIVIDRSSILNYGTEKTPKFHTVSERVESLKIALKYLFDTTDSEVQRLTF